MGDWMMKAVTSSSYVRDHFEVALVVLSHVSRISSMTELFKCLMDTEDLRFPSTTNKTWTQLGTCK